MTRTALLRCPQCNERLSGLPVDVLFFCAHCRIAVDLWDTPITTIPVEYCPATDCSEEHVFYLPVWKYSLAVSVISPDTVVSQEAQKAAPDTLWLFGCLFQKQGAFGDPNIELTRLNPALSFDGSARPIIGGRLRRVHADRLVVPLATAVIDTAQDVTDLEVNITVKSRQLVALPFVQDHKYLRLVNTPFSINRAALSIQSWLCKLDRGAYYP